LAVLLPALVALAGGCVERRMTVRTNPPGAQLYVDDYEIGTTPCSVDFTYYGTRKIRLVKDGYETAVIKQPVPAPWYQYVPFDFITENLVPGHIRDERVVTYQMQPSAQVSQDQLLRRAEALRQNTRVAAAANPSLRAATPPASAPPVNIVPGPVETIPSPAPSPILPSPTQPGSALPGNYPPPGAYPPPGGYVPAPTYVPAPAPTYGPSYPAVPSR
jgi:hypothetical protein